jgi:hypothetical protein
MKTINKVSALRLAFFVVSSIGYYFLICEFAQQLQARSSQGFGVIGSELFGYYTRSYVVRVFHSLDYPALRFYVCYLLLDDGFAFFYSMALMDLQTVLWNAPAKWWWKDVYCVGGGAMKIIENSCLLLVLMSWPSSVESAWSSVVLSVAALASILKHWFHLSSLLLLLFAAARAIVLALSSPRQATNIAQQIASKPASPAPTASPTPVESSKTQ